MPKLKYYIDKNKVDKQGFVPIKANIAIESKNHWKTLEKVKPRHWNPLKQRVTPNREAEPDNRHKIINKLLDEYQAKANAFFNDCGLKDVPITERLVVDFLNGKAFMKNQRNDFNISFLEFLEETKPIVSERTSKNCTTANKFLTGFQNHIKTKLTFDDINSAFFESLRDYAVNVKKYQNNSFSTYDNIEYFFELGNRQGLLLRTEPAQI